MQFHTIWVQQCEASQVIREQHGIENALDYLIGEKLMNFVAASEDYPEFAQELPQFIEEIRRLFTPTEISRYLDYCERGKTEEPLPEEAVDEGMDDDFLESPVLEAEEILRFARVRAMLCGKSTL